MPRSSKRAKRAFYSSALVLVLTSCSNLAADRAAPARAPTHESAGPVVARIDGRPIHQRELDRWLKDDWLSAIEEDPAEFYQLRRAGIDAVIDDALIERAAASSALSPDDYMERETRSLGPVTHQEVGDFYARYRDRIQPAETLEQLRPKIRKFLEEDRSIRVVTSLREAAKIDILMTPPPAPAVARQSVPEGGVSRGPLDAPVTIVEFSDYQCPFCGRAEQTLRQLGTLYPAALRFVYRHFPLEFHDDALPAAIAAVCAEQQGRFWEYHDLLFANQRALGASQLNGYALALGLDPADFRDCLVAATSRQRVADDAAAGVAVGATATPTFFVNGILLRGAQPLEAFRKIIDRELARHPTPRPLPVEEP